MQDKILSYFKDHHHFKGEAASELTPCFPLIDSGVLSSLDILVFVNFLEKTFNIEIVVEDLVSDNFQTIECIEKFLNKKLSSS